MKAQIGYLVGLVTGALLAVALLPPDFHEIGQIGLGAGMGLLGFLVCRESDHG